MTRLQNIVAWTGAVLLGLFVAAMVASVIFTSSGIGYGQ